MKQNYWNWKTLLFVFLISSTASLAQTAQQKQKISEKYNMTKLYKLSDDFKVKTESRKLAAIQEATQKGWVLRKTLSDGRLIELQKVENGQPIYYTTYNVAAAKSTRTDHLNTGGSLGLSLLGQNMTAHVWDGGLARASHQEYDGAGGTNRYSTGDGSTILNFHSAHVAGTIMASGVDAAAKGMAPHAQAVGYDWNSDLAEATTAAANGMLISNHSYGFATRNQQGQVQLPQYYFGGYIVESRDWDQVMFDAPNFLMVVAAGNDGNDNTANTNPTGGSGFDKLTGHATSKNNMVVANAQDANIGASGNLVSVSINSSSSEGPTDDFRIKPDITGNGTSVYSTYESSNTAYNSISGTSMASPNVAGTLLLLQQHSNNVTGSFMRAATLKGLALHTADDAGVSGPDVVFGWGLMNAKRAAEAITENGSESKIEELTLSSGQSYVINVDSDGINPLLASISWTDRAGTANTGTVNLTTPVLVNDLDIRVTKGGTTSFPYKLTGALTNSKSDNVVDPYERVDISGATGTYTITVTHKGSLTGGSQDFSLIVTGLTGTPVICNANVPTGLSMSTIGSSTADASWTAVPGATYDVRHRATGTTTWTTTAVSGVSTTLSGLSVLTQYEVQVRSKCTGGATSAYSSSVNFTTTEVQLNYCASNGNSTADEYIGNVQLGSINNATGAGAGGYTDYTSLSTNLTKNASATITITPIWTGTVYDEGYSVWIDYNKDGDFADAGEQVFSAAASQTTPVSGAFTVPSSAVTGTTRMRVSMKYNAIPTSCEVPSSFAYGEVEDYTVNIVSGVADTTAPVITLVGSATINLNVGDAYTEQGATATDNIDGNLTSSIVTTGTVNTAAAGTYTVNYNVSDAAGNAATQVSRTVIVTVPADTTAPVITLVGSATINLNVGDAYTEQGATATDNVDGNLTSSIVTTGTVNTAVAATYTVNYNVSDAAGNAATQVSRSVVVTETPSGCTGGIASFPYSEGFESGIGVWTQSTSDDINWTVDASGTPSSSTGPSSATEGINYLYIESSGNGTGFPTKTAILNSPCIDLSAESGATFSFSYHMYGSSMGTMRLEASTDGTNWTSLWSLSGDQGNTWSNASVDLVAYAGSTLELRYVGITSTSYRSDMAIDQLSLTTGSPVACNDVTLTLVVDQYPEETSWTITDGGGATVASGAYTSSTPDNSTVIENACLEAGCYTFTINDAYGDGICCTYGNGSYNLEDASGTLLASGGSFTSSQATNFCVGGAVASNSSRYTTNSSNVGVDRFVPSNEPRVYPNPVSDFLILNVPADVLSIRVMTVSGAEMKNVQISRDGIDVSMLKSGIYMVLIQTPKTTLVERVVKN